MLIISLVLSLILHFLALLLSELALLSGRFSPYGAKMVSNITGFLTSPEPPLTFAGPRARAQMEVHTPEVNFFFFLEILFFNRKPK